MLRTLTLLACLSTAAQAQLIDLEVRAVTSIRLTAYSPTDSIPENASFLAWDMVPVITVEGGDTTFHLEKGPWETFIRFDKRDWRDDHQTMRNDGGYHDYTEKAGKKICVALTQGYGKSVVLSDTVVVDLETPCDRGPVTVTPFGDGALVTWTAAPGQADRVGLKRFLRLQNGKLKKYGAKTALTQPYFYSSGGVAADSFFIQTGTICVDSFKHDNQMWAIPLGSQPRLSIDGGTVGSPDGPFTVTDLAGRIVYRGEGDDLPPLDPGTLYILHTSGGQAVKFVPVY